MDDRFSNPEAYEYLMGRWSRVLAEKFLDFVGIQDGERMLDVGCGTGALVASAAARTLRSEIVGIDPIAPFLDYARRRTPDARVRFDLGDALNLPYAPGSFDRCLSLLVIMFIRDTGQAVSEMRRVTRPGGSVAVCVWDKVGMEMNFIFARTVVEIEPAAAQRADVQGYSEGMLTSLWVAHGFSHVKEDALVIPMEFKSFDDFWLPHLGGQGPWASYLSELSPGALSALQSRLREKLLGGRPDGPFTLTAKALAVRGIR
ncbi:MAG TPA: methyltransferase domain-containing protein [Candidatus Binatia bacterium]